MIPRQWTRRQALRTTAAAAGALAGGPLWAQDAKEIRIGQSVHLSGPLAATMTAPLRGQQLAIDELNARGGIGGKPVRLIMLDDVYDPKRAVENTIKLVDEEKCVALFGYASTANIAAALPVIAEKKVPLIGGYGGSPSLRAKHHPYFFTAMASYRDEVVQMIRNLLMTQRSKLGVVYQNHAFGQLMLPVVEAVAAELGATVVAKQSLEMSGADAVAAAQSMAAARPQAVLLMAFGPSTVPVIKALRNHVGTPVYALSIANAKALVGALGDDGRGMAYTQIIPYPWRLASPLTRDFNAAMRGANLEVDYDHFFGYLNTRVLIEGLKRAGANGRAVTPGSVLAGMESIGKFDMGGFPLHYGPNRHHGSAFVEITIVGPRGKYMR